MARESSTLWSAELALTDGSAFTAVEQADALIAGQVGQLPNYRPISLDRVMVGPSNAFRRVCEFTNSEGQTETIVRIYFLAGPWLYNVNGVMLTPAYARISPLVDGIAGSITVAGAPPAPTTAPRANGHASRARHRGARDANASGPAPHGDDRAAADAARHRQRWQLARTAKHRRWWRR